MCDVLSQVFATQAAPTRRDLVARLTEGAQRRGPRNGRTRLREPSPCDSLEGRDAWLCSGMAVGVDQDDAKLDALLGAGQLAGTADGAQA